MRLLLLEMKRVLNTKLTQVVIGIVLVLAVLLAYLPVTFEQVKVKDAYGEVVTLSGRKAVAYYREQNQVSGEVTAPLLKEAVSKYQKVYEQYDSTYGENVPVEQYYEELVLYQPFIRGIKEVFANRSNGIAPEIREVELDWMDSYYEEQENRLISLIELEQGTDSDAKKIAQKKFERVKTPYQYYYGASSNSMDYQTIFLFLFTLLGTVVCATIFSAEYQTNADDILRCTKNGTVKLAVVKVLSACIIMLLCYFLCQVVFLVVTNCLFGWEGTKTSMQIIFSVTSLLPFTIGQLQWANLFGTAVLFLAAICFTMLLSAWAKNNVVSIACALLFVFLPLIVFMAVPGKVGEWLCVLLPGAGIGLSNSLLYAMMDYDFLYLKSSCFWNVDVMLVLAFIKIPLYVVLTVWVYCRRNAKN